MSTRNIQRFVSDFIKHKKIVINPLHRFVDYSSIVGVLDNKTRLCVGPFTSVSHLGFVDSYEMFWKGVSIKYQVEVDGGYVTRL